MTDEPKYMYAINLVRLDHAKHNRSKRCMAKRTEKDKWYVKPKKIGIKLVALCTVCGETVEHYYI
jgi:hypothetical protein